MSVSSSATSSPSTLADTEAPLDLLGAEDALLLAINELAQLEDEIRRWSAPEELGIVGTTGLALQHVVQQLEIATCDADILDRLGEVRTIGHVLAMMSAGTSENAASRAQALVERAAAGLRAALATPPEAA